MAEIVSVESNGENEDGYVPTANCSGRLCDNFVDDSTRDEITPDHSVGCKRLLEILAVPDIDADGAFVGGTLYDAVRSDERNTFDLSLDPENAGQAFIAIIRRQTSQLMT